MSGILCHTWSLVSRPDLPSARRKVVWNSDSVTAGGNVIKLCILSRPNKLECLPVALLFNDV